ncbi:MAG: hypothetical protein ABJO01_08815 [Parasphingorhabdus sp.]|uniref:hypothetical protein n=1 Tax=Parasphingorhabdus sp. TaxID=2709688 RepID=UPI0032983264
MTEWLYPVSSKVLPEISLLAADYRNWSSFGRKPLSHLGLREYCDAEACGNPDWLREGMAPQLHNGDGAT